MGQWRGTISPPDILQYREDTALNMWVQGSAAFMRNWTYAIALSNDVAHSKVAGNFQIASLPSGYSCIGGWQLGINAQASQENRLLRGPLFYICYKSARNSMTLWPNR
jgi:ABC-type glycerol-3-phosphate transport system substrate-binding protein